MTMISGESQTAAAHEAAGAFIEALIGIYPGIASADRTGFQVGATVSGSLTNYLLQRYGAALAVDIAGGLGAGMGSIFGQVGVDSASIALHFIGEGFGGGVSDVVSTMSAGGRA